MGEEKLEVLQEMYQAYRNWVPLSLINSSITVCLSKMNGEIKNYSSV